MTTVLILFAGSVTDRIGGAGAMLYGNIIFSIGAILVAAATTVRSYNFMIAGVIVQSLGDIATQVAQYKVFSSWFAPSNGFASTLGLELGIGRIGSFVGKATANIIAKKSGDFMWVYWAAVFVNLFTNLATLVFFFFQRWTERRYGGCTDPATGEVLTERNRKFELRKMVQLPWAYWGIICFTVFQTSTAIIFSQNATELAEQRFNVDSITAGWYSAASQYLGFFLVPCLGVFIDLFGNRVTVLAVCGTGTFIAMILAAFGPTVSGTAASFGVFAFASSLGATAIIDGIRNAIWYQDVFGFGYAVKIAVNNSMNIVVRIVTGVIQDRDDNSYDRVVVVYVFLASGAVLVSIGLVIASYLSLDVAKLQWTKKQRMAKGDLINQRKEEVEMRGGFVKGGYLPFVALAVLMMGGWSAYFWGVATNNNK
jgi:MFS family permease